MNRFEIIKNLYLDKGINIIPIRPNSKIPAIDKWNKYCTSNFMQWWYWFSTNQDINIAIPCFENNLFVIDIDRHDVDGVENFKKLCNDIGIKFPHTMTQVTPSNGIHLIFKSDDDLAKVKGIANAFNNYPGIDLRNRNYIVSEPSVINGNSYRILNDVTPQKMPTELRDFILKNVDKVSENHDIYKKPTKIEVGDRDNQLYEYINNLYYNTKLEYDEILLLADNFNNEVFANPLSDSVVRYKVRKVFEKKRPEYVLIRIN